MAIKKNISEEVLPSTEPFLDGQPQAEELAPEPLQEKILEQVGWKVLEQHPSLEEVYVSTDGNAFLQESDAKNHALNLEDKTIIKIKK